MSPLYSPRLLLPRNLLWSCASLWVIGSLLISLVDSQGLMGELESCRHVLCLHLTDVSASSLPQYQAWAEALPGMQVSW